MLLHFDFKLLSLVFFVGTVCFVDTTPLQSFSVRYINSRLPPAYDDFIYEAIGMLQMTLEESATIEVALPKFLSSFNKSHPTDGWEISAACKTVILPSKACFIQLEEISGGTEIYLFSSSIILPTTTPSPTTLTVPPTTIPPTLNPTSAPNSFRGNILNKSPLLDTTKAPPPPTTTPPTIPFSVKVTSSNISNTTLIYNAVGALQLFLEQQNSIPLALPLFLETYEKIESGYIWKISSQCSTLILSDKAVYINLLEEYTNTEINLFG